MKKTLLFALVLAAFCIMPSCKKDTVPNDEPADEPNEQASGNIVFGNYEGMIVNTYDSLEWYYSEDSDHVYYSSCINLDSIGDYNGFCLSSHLSRNPIACLPTDPLNYYEINIVSNSENVKFHCNTVYKEAYYHADSTIVQTDSIQLIYIDDILSCNKTSESDQFSPDYSYEDAVLVQHSRNETLDKEDYYKTVDPAFLFQSNAVFPTQVISDTTDVIVYDSFTFAIEECFNFPLDEEFYLGFKYGERLGWIKLVIELNENGHYYPKPLEVAIQE